MNQQEIPRTDGFFNKSLERALQILTVFDVSSRLSRWFNFPEHWVCQRQRC